MTARIDARSLTMPTLFPANPVWGDQRTIHYRDNTSFTITFVTEKAAVEPYLPERVVVPEDPLVIVNYCACRGVDEMGGDGYNLVGVSVAARYEGEEDVEDGDLFLVIWESKFPPVMIGRDLVGYPKVVAEIPDPRMGEDRWSWRVSENGACFLEAELWDLQPLGSDERAALTAASHSAFGSGALHMTYKVIPDPGYGSGAALAEVCGVVHREDFREAWTCMGSLAWHEVSPQVCYLYYGIVEALRKLPIVAYGDCLITRGPHVIELGKSRRLV